MILCLTRLSFPKAFPQVLQVNDDGKGTKLQQIKSFFFKTNSRKIFIMVGLGVSLHFFFIILLGRNIETGAAGEGDKLQG